MNYGSYNIPYHSFLMQLTKDPPIPPRHYYETIIRLLLILVNRFKMRL